MDLSSSPCTHIHTYLHINCLQEKPYDVQFFYDFFLLCPRPSSITYSPGKTQTKVPMSPPFQPTTTQIHLISQGASVHSGEKPVHIPMLWSHSPQWCPLAYSRRGEQLEFKWGSGDPFGEDVWAAIKSRLGAWKQALHFHRESCGPQEPGMGVGVGKAGERKLLVCRWSSPMKQWYLEDGTPRVGGPVAQL